MIVSGVLLVADDDNQRCTLRNGTLKVSEGIITEIHWDEVTPSADFGGPGCLITPGMIDAHLHLPQFPIIGAFGLPLLDWLRQHTFPAEMKWHDVDYARGVTQAAVEDLLRVGTVGIAAYATVHHEGTKAAMQVVDQAGMFGVVGQVLMDQNGPAGLLREIGSLIDNASSLCQDFEANDFVRHAITPRFAITCSMELMQQAAKIAKSFNSHVQTHLSENTDECKEVERLFGMTYVDVYDQAGLLGPRSLLGHGIHLDGKDCQRLSERSSIIAHCPTANRFLNSGSMNAATLHQHQVSIALGSDIGAGYERSMVRVAREAVLNAMQVAGGALSCDQMWYHITAGNAAKIGHPHCARIAESCPANLVIWQPSIEWMIHPTNEPTDRRLDTLMFNWDDRWWRRTLLQRGSKNQVTFI
ncbi:MAG: amidohydrolase family protein [Planctomycetota bacterium]